MVTKNFLKNLEEFQKTSNIFSVLFPLKISEEKLFPEENFEKGKNFEIQTFFNKLEIQKLIKINPIFENKKLNMSYHISITNRGLKYNKSKYFKFFIKKYHILEDLSGLFIGLIVGAIIGNIIDGIWPL
jgi:hypothetical protein